MREFKKVYKYIFLFLIIVLGVFATIGVIHVCDIFFSKLVKEKEIVEIKTLPSVKMEDIISIWIKRVNRSVPKEVADLIAIEICKQTYNSNIPPSLVVSIIQRESHFYPLAESKSKARGLMQVLNGGKGIVIDQSRVYDISYNIEKGIEILNEHLRLKNGDLGGALFGYVGGDKNYVNDVFKIMGEFNLYVTSFSVKNKMKLSN